MRKLTGSFNEKAKRKNKVKGWEEVGEDSGFWKLGAVGLHRKQDQNNIMWDNGVCCVRVPVHILYLGFRGDCYRGCKGLSGVPQVWSGAHHFGSFVTHNVYVILVTININAKVKNCSEGYFFFLKQNDISY